MATTYVQADRFLSVTTPLGKDALLLVGFAGHEGLSQLFNFQLDLIAENKTDVPFDKLLGQPITVNLALEDGKLRHFSGVCNRISQGERDQVFTAYRMEIVPQFWFLTRTSQSKIFQHLSVPDILKEVLDGMNVVYEIQGTFHKRDYCVQYRETSFNFASRVMEEEGMYYFFKHAADGHKMVIANTKASHPDMPVMSKLTFEAVQGGTRREDRVESWEKVQEFRAGKYTLWDHCFELPGKNLEASETIQDSVPVGKVTHKLKVGNNAKFEIYDYPGEYAQRFDGIDKGGGEQAAELQKVFTDNKRTTEIRMQQEALPSLLIQAAGNCRQLVSGHKFTLERHYNADGPYVITSLEHYARLSGNYRSGENAELTYENRFSCIPFDLTYRPLRVTPKPVVQGTQPAVVVGPPGEEIFTDKYGRVKVQFHWDRMGKGDNNSSCWVRVATQWAGRQWGIVHIPRIGQEVVVAFEEGDPDQPIIVGSVYNADQMPPFKLPDHKTMSGIRTRSSIGGTSAGSNEISFEDKKGSEHIFVHGQKDFHQRVENDVVEWVGNDCHQTVVKQHYLEVQGDTHRYVKGDAYEKYDHSISLEAGTEVHYKIGQRYALEATNEVHLKSKKHVLEADMGITLKVGGNFIEIGPAGIYIKGTMVYLNSGGSAGSGSGCVPEAPKAPRLPFAGKVGEMKTATFAPSPPPKPEFYGPQAQALKQGAESGAPFCEKCEQARQEAAKSGGGGSGGGGGAGSGGA